MGLLDDLYLGSNANFGGQQGGLLDFLKSTLSQNDQYQPSGGFSPVPPPASFAQRFDATPNAPQPVMPSSRSFDSASFDPSMYAPNQAQPIAVGNNYQMPRMGDAGQYQSSQAMLPPNAQPTQGQLPQAQAPAQAPPQAAQTPPSFLQPPTQGGFGGAFRGMAANAQAGPLGMIMGAIGGAAGMGRGNPQDIAQQNLKAQFDATRSALMANGVPEAQASSTAMLSVLNPEAAKTVLPEMLTNREKYGVISENPIEGKKYGFVNERDQTINGKSLGAGGSSLGTPGMLAPGVQEYNPSLSGEDYMKQFSPEVQAAAKAYINGDVMPTGNPRAQGIATLAKTVAQKYGMDTGVPVNDQLYAQKRKMQTDLASSGNSSMGGILSNGKSSFKHLAEYTESAADLGNASHNFPMGGLAAHAQNYVGNTLGGSDTQGKIKAISDNLGHYGQESTKFYAASGGGVEERTNALKQMNPATNSGEEVAAYAEKEKNLMLDRFREKEAQIRDTMGESYLQAHPVYTDELKKDIARIDASVAKMRSGAAPAGNATGVDRSVIEAEMKKRGLLK